MTNSNQYMGRDLLIEAGAIRNRQIQTNIFDQSEAAIYRLEAVI